MAFSAKKINEPQFNQYVLIDNMVQKYNGENFYSQSLRNFADQSLDLEKGFGVKSVPNFNLKNNKQTSQIKVKPLYPLKIMPSYPINVVQSTPVMVVPLENRQKNLLKLTKWDNDENIKTKSSFDFNDQYTVSISSFQDKNTTGNKLEKVFSKEPKDQFISPSMNVNLDIIETKDNKSIKLSKDGVTNKNQTYISRNTEEYESKKKTYRIVTVVMLVLSCLLIILLAIGLSVGLSLGLSSKSQVTIQNSPSKGLLSQINSLSKRTGLYTILDSIKRKIYKSFCETNFDCPGSSVIGMNGSIYVTMACVNNKCICLAPYEKVLYSLIDKCVLPNGNNSCLEDVQCERKCIYGKCIL